MAAELVEVAGDEEEGWVEVCAVGGGDGTIAVEDEGGGGEEETAEDEGFQLEGERRHGVEGGAGDEGEGVWPRHENKWYAGDHGGGLLNRIRDIDLFFGWGIYPLFLPIFAVYAQTSEQLERQAADVSEQAHIEKSLLRY